MNCKICNIKLNRESKYNSELCKKCYDEINIEVDNRIDDKEQYKNILCNSNKTNKERKHFYLTLGRNWLHLIILILMIAFSSVVITGKIILPDIALIYFLKVVYICFLIFMIFYSFIYMVNEYLDDNPQKYIKIKII